MSDAVDRLPNRLPGWWFPQSLAGLYPEGRPLAGAGLALSIVLYLIAHVLNVLSGASQMGFQGFVLFLTGQHLLLISPGLVLAALLTASRAQPATPRQQTLDDWTLVVVVIVGVLVAVLAAVGLVVQLSSWEAGFLSTVYDLLIRIGAIGSAGTSAIWALGRLYAARTEAPSAPVTM
ncbi:MAG TPA: hypothetical protein VF137_03625 [Candidatus Dormibacteraeota bacterium]